MGEYVKGGGTGEISNDPFRERFLQLRRQGLTASEVARRMGWYLSHRPADINRVNRVLGLKSRSDRGFNGSQKMVTEETARRLCEALDMDPREAGL